MFSKLTFIKVLEKGKKKYNPFNKCMWGYAVNGILNFTDCSLWIEQNLWELSQAEYFRKKEKSIFIDIFGDGIINKNQVPLEITD